MVRRVTPVIWLFLIMAGVLIVLEHFRYFDRLPARDPARLAGSSVSAVQGKIKSEVQSYQHRTTCVLAAAAVNDAPVRGRLLLEYPGTDFPARRWDEVVAVGSLVSLKPPAAGEFDRRTFLGRQNIHAVISVVDPRLIRVVRKGRPPWYRRGPAALRAEMLELFRRSFSPDKAAVLSGLTLGVKPTLFPELNQSFKTAGVMHLLVASGSNIWFVLGIWLWVVKWTGMPRSWALGSGLFVGVFYVFMAGAEAPVVRAYIMALAMIAGILLARGFNPWHSLSLAGVIILAMEPQALFQLGFQMSFLATAAIVGLVPALERLLPRIQERRWWYLRNPLRLLWATTAAQAALAPLLLYHFHQVAWIGFVSNLLVVPLAGLGLSLGFLCYFSHVMLGSWVSSVVQIVTDRVLGLLLWLVEWFGR